MPEIGNFVISFVRVLFFISPGLVPLSQVSGDAHDLLLLNPMTGLFESYRDALLYGIRRAPSSCSIPPHSARAPAGVFVPVFRSEQRQFAKIMES